MARTARFVVPGLPHHITHRGNLRADMFFADSDRVFYLDMLRQCCDRFKVHVWAYCCMTNHVHLIVVPETEQGLSRALGLAHQRYSSATNARHGWTGSLWANRFYSSPLDESHLWKAVKYVELNPVRANMVLQATDYPWSSARCHAGIEENSLLHDGRPLPGAHKDWAKYLAEGLGREELELLRTNTYTCRPTGSWEFIAELETASGRILRPLKRGRPPVAMAGDSITDDIFE